MALPKRYPPEQVFLQEFEEIFQLFLVITLLCKKHSISHWIVGIQPCVHVIITLVRNFSRLQISNVQLGSARVEKYQMQAN